MVLGRNARAGTSLPFARLAAMRKPDPGVRPIGMGGLVVDGLPA